MSTTDLARLAGHLAHRLDGVRAGMLPVVVLLAVLMSVAVVPLTATGGVLIVLRRGLVAAAAWQGRTARAGGAR